MESTTKLEKRNEILLSLTVAQIRVLHLALETYIRTHDVIQYDCKFDISEMKLLFADLSRYCDLCELLKRILHEHDSGGGD